MGDSLEVLVWEKSANHYQGHYQGTGRQEADQDGADGSVLQFLQGLIPHQEGTTIVGGHSSAIGIVFPYPPVLSCAGGFFIYTYMLLNIHPARIGVLSHGIQYSIYNNKV